MSHYIYCRKSSESEERQVLSIESQIKELQEFTERMNTPVSEVITESRSAKYPGRPLFNEMMRKVYKGEIKGIVAWKLDRLARNPIDGSALVWALDQGQLEEILTPHGTFHNNSNDKLMMQIEFGMAKKYVDDLSDNVKRGNKAKLEKGWLPGLAPLGYLNEPQERTIVIDPERFPIVRKMWDLLFQGVVPSKILDIAEKEWGFSTRFGGKSLSLSGLYDIFANPFYYGLIQRKEGVFAGKHEPVITEDEYWKAQEILGRKGRPRPKKHNFPFTGIIRCAECGSMITAEEKLKKNGKHYIYYRCTKKKRNVKCRQRFLNANDLEKQVKDFLGRIHVPEWLLAMALEYLEGEQKEESEKQLSVEKYLKPALSQCQNKLDNLTRMRLNDLIGDEEYLKEKKVLLQEKIGLEMRLQNCHANGDQSLKLTTETLNFAGRAIERFQNGSPEDKRTIFQKIGSNFFLRDKKLIIEAKKPLTFVEDGLKKVRGEIERLGPTNFLFMEPKKQPSFAQIPSMWAWAESDSSIMPLRTCSILQKGRHYL